MQKQMAMMENIGRHDEFIYSAKHLDNEENRNPKNTKTDKNS